MDENDRVKHHKEKGQMVDSFGDLCEWFKERGTLVRSGRGKGYHRPENKQKEGDKTPNKVPVKKK